MTMYDGASNSNTNYATLLATSNFAPSPQVCSMSHEPTTLYEAYKAFNQSVDGGAGCHYSISSPWSLMVDLGAGNEVLINKYLLSESTTIGTNWNAASWVLQGTNTGGCAAADAKNANGWTDLDTRTDVASFVSYFTFLSDTAYRYYRIYVTKNRYGQTETFTSINIGELRLVRQAVAGEYDGADNPRTTPCTLAATANNLPSPQVISATSESSAAWKAFDQSVYYTSRWAAASLGPAAIMVDLGSGNEKLVNKYKVYEGYNGLPDGFKSWLFQGSNDVTASAGDTSGSSKWTTLDSRTNAQALLGTFITLICGASYRLFRFYVSDVGNPAGYGASTAEIVLVAQNIPIEGDTSESSSSTDSVTAYVAITADVSESSASTDSVNGTKNAEIEDVPESSTSTDVVDVFQSVSICDVDEESESTDAVAAIAGVDVDVSESSESTDSVFAAFTFIGDVIESSTSTDSNTSSVWSGVSVTVSDTIYIRDTAINGFAVLVQDTLGITDSAAARLGLLVSDYLRMVDSQVPNWNGVKTVSDSISILDAAKNALCLAVSDSIAAGDTATTQLWIRIFEYLGFTDLAVAIGNFSHGVSDSVYLRDSNQFGYTQSISDAMSIVDLPAALGMLVGSIADTAVMTDSISGRLSAVLTAADSLVLTDSILSAGTLYNIIYDTLKLSVTVELSGEVWECYVLNTPKFMPSIYSGFSFNSYCAFGNRAFGCKSDGIYELTGTTDNGTAFHTGVELSATSFGSPNLKRFRKAYLGITATGSPLMVTEAENGERKVYTVDTEHGTVNAERSLASKKWKLKVTDFDSLQYLNLIPVVLTR